MRDSISDTAEYGDLTRGPVGIDEHVRETMRSLLRDIQEGRFARDIIAEEAAGVMVPVIAVILGGLVKGEQPAALTYLGAAVVISAILIALRGPHAQPVQVPGAAEAD